MGYAGGRLIPTSTGIGILIFSTRQEEFASKCLPSFYRVSNLKTVTARCFTFAPTERAFDWYMLLCDRLQQANPNLSLVGFHRLVSWRRDMSRNVWAPDPNSGWTKALETWKANPRRHPVEPMKWPAIPVFVQRMPHA